MADESPEQVRERVKAEELSRGVDPRVAEGRAKAAEVRARQGLPVDPEQAWKAKLEREGKEAAPAAPSPEAAEPQVVEETIAVAGPAEPEAPPEPMAAAELVPPSESQPAPAEVIEARAVPLPTGRPAPAPHFEPEVGRPVPGSEDELEEIAGIKMRDARVPGWLVVILVVIPLAALFYLIAFSGGDVHEKTTGCRVGPAGVVTCFLEGEKEKESGAQ